MKVWLLPVFAVLLALTLAIVPGGSASPALAQEADACGIGGVFDVPDSGAVFDFTEACQAHDECYSEGGDEADRNACDRAFLAAMQGSCNEMWPDSPFRRHVCLGVANTYFLGVHFFGWLFFPYSA
jgi:glutamate synthase domain-containing protein 1